MYPRSVFSPHSKLPSATQETSSGSVQLVFRSYNMYYMKELKGAETLKPGDDEQYSNCNIMLQTLNGDSSTRHQQQIPGAHVNVTSLQVNLISTHSIRDEQLQNTHKKSILRLFLHAQWSTYIGYMHILLHNMTNSICANYAYILHVHTYILYTVYVCNVLHVHVRMTSIFTMTCTVPVELASEKWCRRP